MLHVVALSGGKDSTAMALRLAEIEPHDWVLTAQITFEDQRPDIIVPLYMAARLEVQYGD